jgi:hypothetical protein
MLCVAPSLAVHVAVTLCCSCLCCVVCCMWLSRLLFLCPRLQVRLAMQAAAATSLLNRLPQSQALHPLAQLHHFKGTGLSGPLNTTSSWCIYAPLLTSVLPQLLHLAVALPLSCPQSQVRAPTAAAAVTTLLHPLPQSQALHRLAQQLHPKGAGLSAPLSARQAPSPRPLRASLTHSALP